MARINVEVLGEGQHPSEALVIVQTADGVKENLIVDRRSIENGTIDVGYPVGSDKDRCTKPLRGNSVIWTSFL